DHLLKFRRTRNRLAVVVDHDVARLDDALCGRSSRSDGGDKGAHTRFEPEVLVGITRDRGHLQADSTARDFPGAELGQQLAYRVDWNGKSNPDISFLAGVRIDRRVDADHFAPQVEQRTARVARIDGRI